jgi:hypothetical protein
VKVSGTPRRTNVHPPTQIQPTTRQLDQGEICYAGQTSCLGHTFSYSGTVTATGGTGVYENVHGTASTSGTTVTSDPDAATFNVTGTFKY